MSPARLRYSLLAVAFMVMVPLGATPAVSMATSGSIRDGQQGHADAVGQGQARSRSPARDVARDEPATSRKSSYALPASSGKWNFVNATGTLHFKGVLAIVLGKRAVKMNSVTFTRPAKGDGQLTAKLAGHQGEAVHDHGQVRA